MIYIALAILSSTAVLVIFRLIKNTNTDTRHAITINYLIAAITGAVLFEMSPDSLTAPWFWPAVIEGGIFYIVFRAMARTAQVNGVATAGIATKMSVVIPVSVGIFFLNESLTTLKILGIAAGFIAVILSVGKDARFDQWKWPLISFLGIGFIDTSLKLFQVWTVGEAEFPELISTIFAGAFVTGFIHHLTFNQWSMNKSSVISGTILGIINFATLYYMMKSLALEGWESSVIFPITNFGVVLLSTLSAILLFSERLTKRIWSGLGFAAFSIWLLYLSN